jgi:hypothetical protein
MAAYLINKFMKVKALVSRIRKFISSILMIKRNTPPRVFHW